MKSLSIDYKNSVIGKQVLTIATCFKIELKDGRVFGFTTHSRDIKFIEEDLIYKSSSFTPTASSKSSQMNVDNMDCQLLIDNIDIKKEDIEKGLWDNANVYIFRINWMLKPYSYNNVDKIVNGNIGEVEKHKNAFKTEFRSMTQYLQNNIIDDTKSTCNAFFGDNRCKVNKDEYTFTGQIINIISDTEVITSELQKQTDYFNYGIIEFTSGNAKGIKAEIKQNIGPTNKIELQLPLNYVLSIGDNFKITAGCNKNKDTCKNKFNNLLNFRGFSFIPGMDKITGGNLK